MARRLVKTFAKLAFLPLIALCCAAPSGRGDDGAERHFSRSVDGLAEEAARRLPAGRPSRLAVYDFAPTQDAYARENAFGRYYAEALTARLKARAPGIRLFERARLEAVLREHTLDLSGLANPGEAKRIGELAPIDYIVTGSYARLGGRVEINGRMVDVVSGEILVAFRDFASMSDDLKPFFEDEERGGGPKAGGDCADSRAAVESALVDLSTPRKVSALAGAAAAVPFDTRCGEVHYRVIARLGRHGLYDGRYTEFLRKTLEGIGEPHADRRAMTILHYFHGAGPLPDPLWKTALEAAARCSRDSMPYHLCFLFHDAGLTEEDAAAQRRRADEFMSAARGGRLGLPVRIDADAAFVILARSLQGYIGRRSSPLLYYCYTAHFDALGTPDRMAIHSNLRSLYEGEIDASNRDRSIEWICANLNRAAPGEKTGDEMYLFARYLAAQSASGALDGERRGLYARHFARFRAACRESLAHNLPLTRYSGATKDRALFCIKHEIHCPTLVPTPEMIAADLGSEKQETVLRALEYANAMGERARPLEKGVLGALRAAERGSGSRRNNILRASLEVLGAVKARDADTLAAVHRLAMRGGSDAGDAAVKIGAPLVPLFTRSLREGDYYDKLAAVKILGKMGSEAKPASGELRRQKLKTDSARLKEEIDDALMKMGAE